MSLFLGWNMIMTRLNEMHACFYLYCLSFTLKTAGLYGWLFQKGTEGTKVGSEREESTHDSPVQCLGKCSVTDIEKANTTYEMHACVCVCVCICRVYVFGGFKHSFEKCLTFSLCKWVLYKWARSTETHTPCFSFRADGSCLTREGRRRVCCFS